MLTECVIMSSSGVFHCVKNPSLDHASHYALHCSLSSRTSGYECTMCLSVFYRLWASDELQLLHGLFRSWVLDTLHCWLGGYFWLSHGWQVHSGLCLGVFGSWKIFFACRVCSSDEVLVGRLFEVFLGS